MTLSLSFSPCPNDTYLFYAWVHGHVGGDVPVLPTLVDIETLNTEAKKAHYDVTKLSLAAYPHVWDQYQMLPVGMAFGKGYGPKVVGLPQNVPSKNGRNDLASLLRGKRIAIPGKNTTAHLALQVLCGSEFSPFFCPYHEVLQRVKEGQVDYGLLIHETRTHFAHEGVEELLDLGETWQEQFKLYLPLGGIFIQRELTLEKRKKVVQALSDSLEFARQFPGRVEPYMIEHAQDKNPTVIEKHISLYVTEETRSLTEHAKKSVWHFLLCGKERGWWSCPPKDWLWGEKEQE